MDLLIIEFIKNSQEYKNWGVNFLTIGMIVTSIFTLIQSFTLINQNKLILKARSGESLSIILISHSYFSLLSVFFYGISKLSLALIFNGACLGIFYLPILINLLRFKKISTMDIIAIIIFKILLTLMIITPQKDLVYLTFSLFWIISLIRQAYEMIKSPTVGVFDPCLFGVITISLVFWIFYSIIIHAWALLLANTLGCIVLIIIMSIWFVKFYKKPVIQIQ